MFMAQRSLFPASAQVEWPGVAPKNPWAQAFVWIRENTPVDAVFALDPEYMHIAGEDEIGFRCLAQRSRLADASQGQRRGEHVPAAGRGMVGAGAGADSVEESSVQQDFSAIEKHIRRELGGGCNSLAVAGLDCAYQNSAVRVCRIP